MEVYLSRMGTQMFLDVFTLQSKIITQVEPYVRVELIVSLPFFYAHRFFREKRQLGIWS